jgi:C-terminal processing protease CtpA/Prc
VSGLLGRLRPSRPSAKAVQGKKTCAAKTLDSARRGTFSCRVTSVDGVKVLIALGSAMCLGAASAPNKYAEAARELDAAIARNYAYLDKLPGGQIPQSDVLTNERLAVNDAGTLLVYAEKRIASLADHHAITGSSFADSWALVPSYTDLWIVEREGRFIVDAVRANSPAEQAGITEGDIVLTVDGIPFAQAVSKFWEDLGLSQTQVRAEYAARVLVAGRRDRSRRISVEKAKGQVSQLVLPSIYDQGTPPLPPLTVCHNGRATVIRFNNSLGDLAAIAAFDQAMRAIPHGNSLVLDLRDTPSGGNTTVARGIMGWFVGAPHAYQIHNRPAEERETGIARQWIEQVRPREGMYRSSLPTVLVGRWTGSMGEGLAIGFASMGAHVRGSPMAGLKGSIEDLQIGQTDLFVKLPTERLLTTGGQPREEFVPEPLSDDSSYSGSCQTPVVLTSGKELLSRRYMHTFASPFSSLRGLAHDEIGTHRVDFTFFG